VPVQYGSELTQLLFVVRLQVFGTPKGHRKSKPFIDHILHFSIVDDKIWFRNYQV
jgi:ribosome biogenesis protein BRX1